MRLILVRHGETEVNRTGRIQGSGAAPLNATGRSQAKAVASGLGPDAPFVLYCSPLNRAVETARAIAESAGVTPIQHPGLTELDVGEFDGLTGRELRERFPDVMRMWDENAADALMPGGESLSMVQERAWSAVEELSARHELDVVVAVTHNFTIQTILCRLLNIPLNRFRRLNIDLGSITRLELSGDRMRQISVNETWHLK